jgi:hypothetical protein
LSGRNPISKNPFWRASNQFRPSPYREVISLARAANSMFVEYFSATRTNPIFIFNVGRERLFGE